MSDPKPLPALALNFAWRSAEGTQIIGLNDEPYDPDEGCVVLTYKGHECYDTLVSREDEDGLRRAMEAHSAFPEPEPEVQATPMEPPPTRRTGSIPGLLDYGCPVVHPKYGKGLVVDPGEPHVPVVFCLTGGSKGSFQYMQGLTEVDIDLTEWSGRVRTALWIDRKLKALSGGQPFGAFDVPRWQALRAANPLKLLPPVVALAVLLDKVHRGEDCTDMERRTLYEVLTTLAFGEGA